MRHIIMIVVLAIGTTLWLGCSKKDEMYCGAIPCSEADALDQYITTNNIKATKDSSGFYYNIEAAGAEEKPNSNAEVTVNYVGTLTNGSTFDTGKEVTFSLRDLVTGWQMGIPHIGKGGKIVLYLPPSLGYGSKAIAGIPANSILVFSIELINFRNP